MAGSSVLQGQRGPHVTMFLGRSDGSCGFTLLLAGRFPSTAGVQASAVLCLGTRCEIGDWFLPREAGSALSELDEDHLALGLAFERWGLLRGRFVGFFLGFYDILWVLCRGSCAWESQSESASGCQRPQLLLRLLCLGATALKHVTCWRRSASVGFALRVEELCACHA